MIRAAAETFQVQEEEGAPSFNWNRPVEKIAGPLKVTVVCLEDHTERIVMVAAHLLTHTTWLYEQIREMVSQAAGVPLENVVVMSSHNHSSARLSTEPQEAFWGEARWEPQPALTAVGRQFMSQIEQICLVLPDRLVPVRVYWGVGHESRIQYNRKGRRADGSTYLMREDDRVLLARDFTGDVDTEAPVVVLIDSNGGPVLAMIQFTAHPATAFHPERPCIFGEYAQTAADHFSTALDGIPVAFLQGCSGDVNSKGLLTGDLDRARKHGDYLGETYVEVVKRLKRSESDELNLAHGVSELPLCDLPPRSTLLAHSCPN